jgi:hemolysin D
MSVTTTKGKQLTRGQSAEMPALLEFYSPSAALMETRTQAPARGVIWTVASMFVACALAAGLIPIDKVVTASGKVSATENTIVIQPFETSIVREIDVHEGQSVKKGQLLAKLDPTFAGSDATASVQSVDSLRAEVERREAERAGVDYHPTGSGLPAQVQAAIFAQRKAERAFRIENYKQKIDSLTATLAKAVGDIQAYNDRLQVATTVEGKRRELEQLGWGSQLNRLAAQDTRLDLQRSLTEAQQTAKSAANDLKAMKAEAAGDDQNWKSQNATDLTTAQRLLDTAQGDLNKNALRSKLVEIRADQDATVLTVAAVSVGSVLQSGDQLLLLVPQGAPLEVDGTVLGSDAGYVQPGDHVTLKFDTFEFMKYGSADGTVMAISPDSFTSQAPPNTVTHGTDPNAGAVLPDPGKAYFRVKISMDKINLHDTPRGFHVAPGMPITADIMVGKRTVLSYMFSRVMPVGMDGMREP